MTDADEPVEVPFASLRPETLRAVVEEFVTRAATDYGERERSLESKIEDVMRQLRRGDARILFDPESNSVNIVPRRTGAGS